MDKEMLPRWGWLLVGLFAMAIFANLVNVTVLSELGLPERYWVVTVIAGMAPVLIYIGVWYDEERQPYWDHSRAHMVGDVLFVFTGAVLGASIVLVALEGTALSGLLEDLLAMGAGFLLSWGLFWWRNPELYGNDDAR